MTRTRRAPSGMAEDHLALRRTFAVDTACLMLAEAGIRRFPLDCGRLLRAFEADISFISFSKIPRITPEDNALLEAAVRDGMEIERNGKHVIFFPDLTVSPGRYRFTICHELGHYFLGHFDRRDFASLTDARRRRMDRESDIFASNMLCPAPVAVRLNDKIDGQIMFGMSREAWEVRKRTAAHDLECMSPDIAFETVERFAPYMYGRQCRACGAVFIDDERKSVCPVCGGTRLEWKPQGKDDVE